MNKYESDNQIALTREVGIKEHKRKINWKKMLINLSIILVIAVIVIALVFSIKIAKEAL